MYKFHEILNLKCQNFIIANYESMELYPFLFSNNILINNTGDFVFSTGELVQLNNAILNLTQFIPNYDIKVGSTVCTENGDFLITSVNVPEYTKFHLPQFAAVLLSDTTPQVQALDNNLINLAMMLDDECGIIEIK